MQYGARIVEIMLLATLLFASSVFADEDEARHLNPIWLTLQGGPMLPSGAQGQGLDRGYQLVGTLGYVMGTAFLVEGDLGYVSSPDSFRGRIYMISLNGRLNPSPDWSALYVRAGAGLYRVTHTGEIPGVTPPRDFTRPGLSFGMGYDIATVSRFTIGVLGTYHGIVVARSDALSYVSLSAYVSFRPGD